MKKRVLVVVPIEGSGIVPPILNQIGTRFEIVDTLYVQLPKSFRYLYLVPSFRLPRNKWFDEWMRLQEKTPQVFMRLTRICEKLLQPYAANIDAIIQLGAMHSLGRFSRQIPYIVIADSTRKLSAGNPHDKRSHFTNKKHETLWYKLERDVYANASGLVARSTTVAHSFINDYGMDPAKILTRNFGVGLNHSDGTSEKQYDGKTVLFVGKRGFEEKGGDLLLDAFPLVLERVPEARLIIVGKRLPPMPHVVSYGRIRDRHTLRKLYEEANVFTLPSYTERFGMSFLEAMAASTPCIGVDYGAMPEVLRDAGFVIPPGDKEVLAEKIVLLLKNKALAEELGRKARRRFETELSWDAVGSDVFDFIEACFADVEKQAG